MRTRWIVALLATSGALALPVQAQRMCSPTASNLQTAVGPGVYELAYSPSQQAVYAAVAGGFKDDAPPSSLVQLDAANLQEKAACSCLIAPLVWPWTIRPSACT